MTGDAIERLAAIAAEDPETGLVGSQLGEGGTPANPEHIYCKGLPENRTVFDGRWALKTYFIHFHEALSPTHTLIKSGYLKEEDPFYDKRYLAFDAEVCLRLMLKSKYGFVHSPIAWRRVHEQSVSAIDVNDEMNMKEWLDWLERYGPSVMPASELALCRRTHLRHHFRRLLLWRFKARDKEKYERHLAFLKSYSIRPGLSDYAGALFEWGVLALRNRRHEIGAVRALWPIAEAELRALSDAERQPVRQI